jgi:hypothetical protein
LSALDFHFLFDLETPQPTLSRATAEKFGRSVLLLQVFKLWRIICRSFIHTLFKSWQSLTTEDRCALRIGPINQ